jgi:hypothetical protein
MEFISHGGPKRNEVGNRWYFRTNASGWRQIKSHATVALKLFRLSVVKAAECLFPRMCRCVTGWGVPDVSEHRDDLIFKGRNVRKEWISNNDATPRPNFERRPQMPPYDNLETRTIADCEGWYTVFLTLGGKSDGLRLMYVKQQPSGKINWTANRYSTFSWKKNGALNTHDKVTRLLRNLTTKCTLFKLFEFNSWRLLHVSNIMCSSSGRPFVHAVLYGMVFILQLQ